MEWNLIFITSQLTDNNVYYRGGGVVFPLYLYPDKGALDKVEKRHPNLNSDIVKTITDATNLSFTEEETEENGSFAPIDILDYIYAVLHSPAYRTQNKEFLKIDFPHVPYPVNAGQFKILAEFGATLRRLHLFQGVTPQKDLALYPIKGSSIIDSIVYKDEKVFINKQQYFDKVPPQEWIFYIGGYQPAQKWLKDRKGRTLNFDDIQHYQKIISVLHLTGDIQRRIDEVIGR
jgi:predicted helicase